MKVMRLLQLRNVRPGEIHVEYYEETADPDGRREAEPEGGGIEIDFCIEIEHLLRTRTIRYPKTGLDGGR